MSASGGPDQGQTRHTVVSRALNLAQNRFFVPLPTWLPVWLVVVLSASGVIAFTIAGFAGYPNSPRLLGASLFYHPVALFVWAAILLFGLERSFFEHPIDKGDVDIQSHHRPLGYGVTLLCILVAAAAFLRPDVVNDLLSRLARSLHTDQGKLIFTSLNFYLIGMFWFDVAKRYVQRRTGNATTDKETLYSNLFAASLLCGMLALLMRADVVDYLLRSLQVGGLSTHSIGGAHVSDCTVSWVTSNCTHGIDPQDLPTLTFLDLVQALVYVILGGFILGIASTKGIFPPPKASAPPAAKMAPEQPGSNQSSALAQDPAVKEGSAAGASQSNLESMALAPFTEPSEVVEQAARQLPSAIIRATFALLRSLRIVLWPALMLLATGAIVAAAHYTQRYLHTLSCEHQLAVYKDVKYCSQYRPMLFDSVWLNYQYILSAVAWVVVAGVSATLSLVLLLFDWGKQDAHIPDQLKLAVAILWYWLRTLGTVGVAILAPVLVFSLVVLWPSNFLLKIILRHQVVPLPFHPPGVITYVAFVFVLAALAVRRRYSPTPPKRDDSSPEGRQRRQVGKLVAHFPSRRAAR